jgi:2-polyprenyl-6-hydroxyphenyl methylase/3-demethylubiquinone-9 3-methyltransferase
MGYDFHRCKACDAPAGAPRYRLRRCELWVCGSCGFHYIDHLDAVQAPEADADAAELDPRTRAFIETQLHANAGRLREEVRRLEEHVPLPGSRVLDVGCGGGLFLAALRERGAEVHGVELDPQRVAYARAVHGLEVTPRPVEDPWWRERHAGTFDAVTFWDVIEHVDFPAQTLAAAAALLRPGGVMLVGTPSREAFYHRAGVLTYRASRGRYPTFLNGMYSPEPFSHKQILSPGDLRALLARAGLEPVSTRLVHDMTFPCRWYLRKALRSRLLAELAHPLAAGALALFRIRNKMIVAARKPASA